MDKKDILKACRELASVNAGIARIVEHLTTEELTPRKPPARAGRVIEMRKRAGRIA